MPLARSKLWKPAPDACLTMPHRRTAILMLLATTAAWGLSFPGGKALMAAWETALPGRASWFFSALMIGGRFGLGALLLLAVHPRALVKTRPSEWRQGLGLGLAAGLGMLFQSDGLTYAEASTSAFLTQFTAVLVPLVVALRTRRAPTPWVLFCVGLVVAGVAVLSRLDWHRLHLGRGELETLISTLFFTFQILWLEQSAFAGNHTGRVTLVMFATIAALLLPIALCHTARAADLAVVFANPAYALVFLGLTLCCSVFAFLMMNRWQREVEATTAGIIYCAEPVFATLFALFLPGWLAPRLGIAYTNEIWTPHLLLGGTLITVANILICIRSGPAPAKLSEH